MLVVRTRRGGARRACHGMGARSWSWRRVTRKLGFSAEPCMYPGKKPLLACAPPHVKTTRAYIYIYIHIEKSHRAFAGVYMP